MEAAQGFFSLAMSVVQAPAELKRALQQLEAKLPSARLLISRSEWGMFKNKDLDELILQLKHATYDAEDLLRDFGDRELRQKIEDAGRSKAGQLCSSFVSSAAHLLRGGNGRIRETQDKLDEAMAEVEKELSRMGLHVVPEKAMMPTTTEIIIASQVFGRDTERDRVMEMLGVPETIDNMDKIDQVIKQMCMPPTMGSMSAGAGSSKRKGTAATTTRKSAKRLIEGSSSSSSTGLAETASLIANNVSVLPIFGIGGIGKTTLAQLIYNHERVRVHFTVRIWVCVSDLFDEKRMVKEIVETISEPNTDLPCDLRGLQAKLQEKIKSQKFLLVLDDMWEITKEKWEQFYAQLSHGLEGSMILVTTRDRNMAHLVATSNCKPVQLEGLPADTFWEFFKKCVFDKELPESYPNLQDIGRSISSKLCGTPLAAKTLGRLLNSNLTEEHWMTVNNSELWEQEQKDGEILPALRLSYLHLPYELKRCFAFCSMFPKGYSFDGHEIVDIWVAEGFVAPQGRVPLEDIGISYLEELRGRCLFQTDPNSPDQNRYVMHDLIHGTAQQVSMHECFLMKDLNRVVHKLRHMSVEVDGKSLSTMEVIQHLNKLRSLRFGTKLDVEITWFSQLSNILFLSLRGCKLEGLPESICELSSLRYLDISHSHVKELPERFWRLYSLQVVDANRSRLRTVHQDVIKLTNLRRLALPMKASMALSKVRGLGNLSCLRNLSYFTIVRKNRGFQELKGMNQLRGTLCIRSIHTVKSKEEAAEARLIDKKYLKELDLHWRINPDTLTLRPSENEVIDGLCPYERIERLKVHHFWGDRLPSWLNPKNLQNLRSLEFSDCLYFETLSIPHFASGTQDGSTGQHASTSTSCSNSIAFSAFTHLTAIRIAGCHGLKTLDQFLTPKNLPSVESIMLERCHNLESIPADSFVGFVHLRDLKLCSCGSLVFPYRREMVLPPSLRRLCIVSCGQLDRSFLSCLKKATSLTVLCLTACQNIESIPLDLIPCRNTLRFLLLACCDKLSSIGRSGIPSSIECVSVSCCPKLTQVQQPYKKNIGGMSDTEFLQGVGPA
ncbi:unnamed protein product [Urochloa humidicola]